MAGILIGGKLAGGFFRLLLQRSEFVVLVAVFSPAVEPFGAGQIDDRRAIHPPVGQQLRPTKRLFGRTLKRLRKLFDIDKRIVIFGSPNSGPMSIETDVQTWYRA